MAQELVEN